MQVPLLSIVTVTKNCATTIERTLTTVQAVKAPDVEYILIDGESSDGTLLVIDRFDGVVDKFVSERDTGIYNAMNKGVALASGRYILFINGDDELIPDALLEAKKILASAQVDVLCCSSLIASDDDIIGTLIPRPRRLFFYNSIPHPSAFVASALLKTYGFREDLKIASDYDLFLRMMIAGKRFLTVDLATAIHHRGGVSSNSNISGQEVERVKRERLGATYILVYVIQRLHRLRKMAQEMLVTKLRKRTNQAAKEQ